MIGVPSRSRPSALRELGAPSDAARRRLLAAAALLPLLATGCGNAGSGGRASDSSPDLGKYLAVPKATTGVAWELVTLPEHNDGPFDVPGPTDYVALVAALRMAAADRDAFLSTLPSRRPAGSLPGKFVHDWMTPDVVAGCRGLWSGTGDAARDARAIVRASCRFAAAGAYAQGVVVYVEYVAPNGG